MSKTLNYGARTELRLSSRIDRLVIRRRTPCGFDRLNELAAADYARHVSLQVAQQVTPRLTRAPVMPGAPVFGKRHV